MLYTPFLPEAAAGTLEPRHVVTPLREILKRTYLRLGEIVGHDPEAKTVELHSQDGDDRGRCPTTSCCWRSARSRGRCRCPGSGRARDRVQRPGRRDLAAQPRDRDAGGSKRERGRRPPRRAAHLRLRRRRLRRPRGAGRAAGLRRRRDGELPARPPARDALGAGRGQPTGSCRRSTSSSPTTPCASCAGVASTSAWRRCWRRSTRRLRPPLQRRDAADPDRGLDRRRHPEPDPARPQPAAGRARPGPGRRPPAGRGLDSVWAIGDCAAAPDPRGGTCPPTAQHAVRQGPVAARNIAAELGIGSAAALRVPRRSRLRQPRPLQGGGQDRRAAPSAASRPGGWPGPTT